MPLYRFTAVTSAGVRVTRECEAANPDALLMLVAGQFATIENIRVAAPEQWGQLSAADTPDVEAAPGHAARELGRHDAAEVGRHIAELVSARLPLETGLAALAEECSSRRVRTALWRIAGELATGAELSHVLEHSGAPRELKALVQAGARSGRTAEVLERYVENLQAAFDLRNSVWLGLAYPLALLAALWGFAAFLGYWVVPQFLDIFSGFDIEVPRATVWLADITRAVRNFGGLVTASVVLIVLAVAVMLRLSLGRVLYRKLICRVPVIGSMLRSTALARFSRLMGLMIENGVPLNESLVLAARASGDAEIEHDCQRLVAAVEAGETLAGAAARLGRFPRSFVRALSSPHAARGMPEILQSIGDTYANRMRLVVALVLSILPPALMIIAFVTAGYVVVALFLPLIQLLNNLS